MPGVNYDVMIFGANIDGSGGDVAWKMPLGEKHFGGNGVAGAATIIYPKEKGQIVGFFGVSEDGALVNYRWRDSERKAWMGGALFQGGQTENPPFNRRYARCDYPVDVGSLIECTMTNAAAKIDALGLICGKGGARPAFSTEPFKTSGEIGWYEATTAHTSTADTLVSGAITFPDLTLDRDAHYRILGSVHEGATLMLARYDFPDGPDEGNRPLACIGGDTDQLNAPFYHSLPPTFSGRNGVNLETLCSAGDTASVGMMLLQKVGGRKVA